ncbi:MAG: sodium:calcium antiporter, partial [Gemmobacter sp.]|nr:sodium:calcium antiporter [Gemmobacter sp.]
NLLGIIGVAGLFGDLPVPQELLRFDLWIMLGASLVLAPFVLGKRDMGRMMGVGMIGAYGVYAVSLVI